MDSPAGPASSVEPLTVIVLVKPVPDPRKSRGSAVIDPERKTLRRQGVPLAIDTDDRYALEAAVALKGHGAGRVVTVGMGPPEAEGVIQETLALGADAGYLLSDRPLAGSDALATARALAAAARKIGFGLIAAGVESSDAGTGQVGPTVAAILGLPHVPHCRQVLIEGSGGAGATGVRAQVRLKGRTFDVRAGLPAVLTFERLERAPRPAGFAGVVAARSRPCTVWALADLDLPASEVGPEGSPTVVREIRPPAVRRRATVLEGDAERVADRLLAILAAKGAFPDVP